METIKDILLEKIEDAELVLVGIGEEFEELVPKVEENPEFSDALRRMEEPREIRRRRRSLRTIRSGEAFPLMWWSARPLRVFPL